MVMMMFFAMAGLANAGIQYTSCQETWDRPLQYINRVGMTCRDEPLRGFKLLSWNEDSHCKEHRHMRWRYECGGGATMAPTDVSPFNFYFTLCNDVDNKQLNYLDRHWLDCPANKVMTHWTFTTQGCSNKQQRAIYWCAQADTGRKPAKTVETGCNQGSTQMQYLDRHDLKCPAGYAIQEWGLIKCSHGGDIKLRAVCVYARTPTPKPTPNPTPAPTDEPTTVEPTVSPSLAPTQVPTTAPTSAPVENLLSATFEDFMERCDNSDAATSKKDCTGICGGNFKKGDCKKPGSPRKIKCRGLKADQCIRARCNKAKYDDDGLVKKCGGSSKLEKI